MASFLLPSKNDYENSFVDSCELSPFYMGIHVHEAISREITGPKREEKKVEKKKETKSTIRKLNVSEKPTNKTKRKEQLKETQTRITTLNIRTLSDKLTTSSLHHDEETTFQSIYKYRSAVLVRLDEDFDSGLLREKFNVLRQSTLKWFANKYELKLRFIPVEFRKDKEFVLKTIRNNPFCINQMHTSLRNDKEVIFQAFENNLHGLLFASDELKNNKEFMRECITRQGKSIRYASERLRNDKELAMLSLRKGICSFKHLSKRLRSDRELILQTFSQEELYFSYLNGHDQLDRDTFLRKMLDCLKMASPIILQDGEFMTKLARKCSVALDFLPNLASDREFYLQFVSENSLALALSFAPISLLSDKNFMMECVSKNGLSLFYATTELKNDKEIVITAVQQNSKSWFYTPPPLQIENEILLSAVKKNSGILKNVKLSCEDLKLDIARECGCVVGSLTKNLKREALVKRLAYEYPELEHIKGRWKVE